MNTNSNKTVFQVSDLVNQMSRLMESSYPDIWIEGELSSLSTPASGHLYFSLKDSQSQLRCAMFRGRAQISRYKPKAGDLVRVRAKISVYAARGDLQCIVQHIEAAGEGLLQQHFEELKNKLNQQGLFKLEHKQPLPSFAKHIGLISSPTGAAIKDVLSTLKRRCPSIPVTIYPAVVQGDSAAKTIIEAITAAVQHQSCDVIILARGGGSLEDLWCFNDEQLAQHIFNCPVPIISGVGHEVDITIADLVADHRAPTPTAAAEIISPDMAAFENRLSNLSYRMQQSLRRQLRNRAQTVDQVFKQLIHPKQQLINKQQRLGQISSRINNVMQHRLQQKQTRLQHLTRQLYLQAPNATHRQQALQTLANRLLLAKRQQLKASQLKYKALSQSLHTVSPLATLDRGFSITRDVNDTIIRSIEQCKVDDRIEIQLKQGYLDCRVNQLIEKK